MFDQERWFVPYFSIMAAGMGVVTLLNNRALHRFRARSVALSAGGLQICAASTMLALAPANGGRPPFVLWIAIFSLANACMVAFFPLGQSLALEPMGKMAGTAAAVLGFTMMLIGRRTGRPHRPGHQRHRHPRRHRLPRLRHRPVWPANYSAVHHQRRRTLAG